MPIERRNIEATTCADVAHARSFRFSFTSALGLLLTLMTALPSVATRAHGNETTSASVAAPTDAAEPKDAELSAAELAAAESAEEEAAFLGDDDRLDGAESELAGAPADAVAAAPAIAGDALPAEQPAATAIDDELWFVSARRARIVDGEAEGFDYWRYEAGRWSKSSLDAFVAADPKIPTCFHVHGNRVSVCEANLGGWHYYSTFTCGGCRDRGPLRWVIFSWPSDRLNCGSRKDVQIKAVRAECYGYYLAWLVDRLSPDARVSMLGYSFGTRLIGSSLHYLGGGKLRGRQLAELQVEHRHVRTVMLAAALDNTHFSPGHTMQAAPTQIDHLLLGLNPSDPALKWYALLYQITLRPRRGQQALGYSGVAGLTCLPELNGRVEQRNLSCAVGREHDTHGFHYLTPWFVERMRTYVYFEDVAGK